MEAEKIGGASLKKGGGLKYLSRNNKTLTQRRRVKKSRSDERKGRDAFSLPQGRKVRGFRSKFEGGKPPSSFLGFEKKEKSLNAHRVEEEETALRFQARGESAAKGLRCLNFLRRERGGEKGRVPTLADPIGRGTEDDAGGFWEG